MPDRFPAKGNFQGKPFERIFTSNKFLSAINATKNSSPINARNTHVAGNLH